MKPPCFLSTLLVLTVLASAVPAPAQDTAPKETPPAKLAPPSPVTISVDFPGGSIAQLIAAIAKTSSGPINIIGEQRDLATQLPPFSVQNVVPQTFALALNQLLDSRGLTLAMNGPAGSGYRDVFTLRRIPNMMSYLSAFESIQLGPYLEQQSVDDIVSAIRTAWELDPSHDAAALRLKYHPATTILLISGPQDAIMIAQKVVAGTLKRTDKDRKSDAKASPPAAEKK